METKLNKKRIIQVMTAFVLLIVTIFVFVNRQGDGDVNVEYKNLDIDSISAAEEESGTLVSGSSIISDTMIFVDVSGAVNDAGVVEVELGSRVFQAIDAAGGLSDGAVTRYMNLAAVLCDGDKIYVPSESEVPDTDESAEESSGLSEQRAFDVGSVIGGESVDTVSGDGAGGSLASAGRNSNVGGSETADGDRVNINTADSAILQTVTGIGPATAQKIIDYRSENGKFASVSDLTNVDGIGEKTLDKFADKLCV